MSLLKDTIQSLSQKGVIEHTFLFNEHTFIMRPLNTEEQLLADGMFDEEELAKRNGATGIKTLSDTIMKHREVAKLSYAIRSIDGTPPVDEKQTIEKQFEQRTEFRDELMSLSTPMLDYLLNQYRAMMDKQREFFKSFEENIKKSSPTPSGE